MALPKIETPTFMLELPSTKENIKYRPFTVKEEKILLMASQSEDEKDIQNAIEQILTNCVMSNIKIKALAPYDIEYLFLNLRAKSVNNIIELKITDDDDGNEYEISINLDDIKVTMPERNDIVQINDSISLVMKDPDYATVKKLEKKSEDQMMNSILIECIDQILVDDEVILLKDHTKKEQDDFINSFSSKDMRNVEQYFNLMPKLSHDISYTREDGTEVTKTLEGMQSFFT